MVHLLIFLPDFFDFLGIWFIFAAKITKIQ